MSIAPLRAMALVVALAALVRAVVNARRPGSFPLATLMVDWFARIPSPGLLAVGVGAGIASVVLVPLIAAAGGGGQRVAFRRSTCPPFLPGTCLSGSF